MTGDRILPCGICGKDCSHLGARGNTVVCWPCAERAVDSTGRPIEVSERWTKQNGILTQGGPTAYFTEPDPEAEQICQEVTRSYKCWVDGIEVRVYEGVAGWLGLVMPNSR